MKELKQDLQVSFREIEETIKSGQQKLTGCPKFLAEACKKSVSRQLDIMANKIISDIKECSSNNGITPEEGNELILFALQQIKIIREQNDSWEG